MCGTSTVICMYTCICCIWIIYVNVHYVCIRIYIRICTQYGKWLASLFRTLLSSIECYCGSLFDSFSFCYKLTLLSLMNRLPLFPLNNLIYSVKRLAQLRNGWAKATRDSWRHYLCLCFCYFFPSCCAVRSCDLIPFTGDCSWYGSLTDLVSLIPNECYKL